MSTITVNVGLAVAGKRNITTREAIHAVEQYGFIVGASRLIHAEHAKGSEDTLVARITDTQHGINVQDRLWLVAHLLEQEAIAVRLASGRGVLVGPKAHNWGQFNSAFFHEFVEEIAA